MSHYSFSPEEKAEQKAQLRFLHEKFYMQSNDPQTTITIQPEDVMRKPVKKVQPMRKPAIKESKLAPPRPTITGKKPRASKLLNAAAAASYAAHAEPKKDSAKFIIIDKAISLLTAAGKEGVKFSVLIKKILAAHKDIPKNTIVGMLVVLNGDHRISKPSRGLYVLKGN